MRPLDPFDPEFDASSKGKVKDPSKRRWLLECLFALVLCSPVNLFIWWPILTSPNFGKPLGRGVPIELPDEANRVVHPQGFSIILPPNWDATILSAASAPAGRILAAPRQLLPARWHASLTLSNYGKRTAIDLPEHRPVWFQGMPAFEGISTRPGVFLERPPHFHYSLAFQRAGAWYELTYSLSSEQTTIPQIIQSYLNTFKDKSDTDQEPGATDHG
jgi:hypothetical protein